MRAIATLLSVALIACFCGEASSAPPELAHQGATLHAPVRANGLRTLYDQTGHGSGIGIVAQNFEDEWDIYDDMLADDFAVPDGRIWKIKEVEIAGTYFDGVGPARSLNIAFYKNKDTLPGKLVAEYVIIATLDDQGSFVVRLPKRLRLKSGRYWMSIQANMDFVDGEWGWETATIVVDDPALFQNPGDGFASGCTTWTPLRTCIPFAEGDMLFALRGNKS